MKLYTEEQVKSAFRIGLRENYIDEQDAENFANKGIKYLTPIELPSDEDIDNDAKEFVTSHDFSLLTNPNHLANRCFQLGAKWMKEQILKQNK